jgi:hypothetical protein
VCCEHGWLAARRNSDHGAAYVTTIASLIHESREEIRVVEVRWNDNRIEEGCNRDGYVTRKRGEWVRNKMDNCEAR